MTEQDILNLITNDPWMMDILRVAERLNLPDWVIGAGFVRNKVWDFLHGYKKAVVETNDIDLAYYNPTNNTRKSDEALSEKLKTETKINWEVVNEAYAHEWNGLPPYQSTEDALAQWPETATTIGVKLDNNELKLVTPYGIGDLVNLVIRPSPRFTGGFEKVKQRSREKHWLEKWPKLKLVIE